MLVIKSGDPCEENPFVCKCIKEVWVLLQFLGDSLADARTGKAKNNYSQLEKSLLLFINQNSLPGSELKIELLMRRYIYISSIICLERWWKPMRSEIVMIFWEYFHRRLNMSLLLPGSGPASLQQISKSALGMLARVKERIREEEITELEEDSFCVFLKFLGRYLTHCHKEEGTPESSCFRQWQQMRGRLYSKLGPTKVKGLSQLGLHRLINLFLTLCVTADIKEVGKKMLDVLYLLSPWDPSGRDMAKRELIMQAHLCLLCLHVQHEIDVAEIAKPLIVEVQRACSELSSVSKLNVESVFSESWKLATAHSEGLRKLLSLFVEGLHEIVSSSLRMCLSEYTLIGPWISSWLKICSTAACRRFMDTILSILEKLQTLRESVSQANEHISHLWEGSAIAETIEDGEGTVHLKEQWNKMEVALVENVLPTVQSLCFDTDPPFQVAELAVYFTLASFNGGSDNFTQLFTYFAASDAVNYRSSLLSIDESNIGELEDLTHIVVKLQKVSHILNIESNSASIIPRTIDSFKEFLMLIAERYDSYQTVFEKSKFREQCSVYFSKIDKIIGPHIRAPTSQSVVMSIYHACGMMVLHCGNIIYTKFARGLAKLSPNTDPYIKRCLKDMITHYLPCLYEKNQSFSSTPHPFLVSFETKNPEDEILQFIILDILSSVFLTSKGKIPHAHAFKELLKQIATCSLPGLLEFLLGVDESLEEWTKSLNLINKIVLCLEEACKSGNLINEIIEGHNRDKESGDVFMEEVGNPSKEKETWREVFCSAVKKFFQQHMAFSASAVFRVMQRLIHLNPKTVNASMGDLEEEVKKVELRRGVGYDPLLRLVINFFHYT
ncbi:hypothetical protein J437_LFUL011837 [Ladona fulva]|uniref:Protein MMS22-like n=1 Tax=Ladona fulva TaxID=123851 RepID=A0A8K0K5J6_LADFU|nr:hypothetical protein J437_LFUL011837 [Ladona fulva]